jgi:hypothetical protein
MSKNITAIWANKRAKDIEKTDTFKLKKCLKKIKKSANNNELTCKIEFKISENVINEIKNLGFGIEYHKFYSTAFPIPYTCPAHYTITW